MTKKGLALALTAIMVWALAVPAFAATEPFPDVPQDHWAYEAVESLRTAGLIEGYPDGTFSGERTFTRYEMAMVFSRILERLVAWLEGREELLISAATGEVISALGQEFAPELQELGITDADLTQLMLAMNTRIQALEDAIQRADDRAYRARLAAEQARALAMEAQAIAERGLAIAEMAYNAEEVKAAVEAAEQANDRAYRARLAAEDARAQARDAREVAERALAIAEMNADAGEKAEQAAAEARDAADLAQQADRLAFLAHLSAERALQRIDELQADVDEVKARPVLGGEVGVEVSYVDAEDKDKNIDPRDDDAGTIGKAFGEEPYLKTNIGVIASVEPAEGVLVQGGLKVAATPFGKDPKEPGFEDLFVKVTTPGTLRMAYAGNKVDGKQIAEGFSPFALDADRYDKATDTGRAAIIDTEIGALSSRIIASSAEQAALFGVTTTAQIADGINVGVDYLIGAEQEPTTVVRADVELGNVKLDAARATVAEEEAIAASAATTLGIVDVSFDYYNITGNFADTDENATTTGNAFARDFKLDKHGMKAGYSGWTLSASPSNGLFGLDVTVDVYGETKLADAETRNVNRVAIGRTFDWGFPLSVAVTNVTEGANTYWTIGADVEDYAITETIAISGGVKLDQNPLKNDNWKNPEVAPLRPHLAAIPDQTVEYRTTGSLGISVAVFDGFTVKGSVESKSYSWSNNDEARESTFGVGAEYTLPVFGADVTLGADMERYSYTAVGAPDAVSLQNKLTASIGLSRDLFGGTVDSKVQYRTGAGSDGPDYEGATDTLVSVDYTYPIADGMDFTLSGKFGDVQYEDASKDYRYLGVKAAVGLKF